MPNQNLKSVPINENLIQIVHEAENIEAKETRRSSRNKLVYASDKDNAVYIICTDVMKNDKGPSCQHNDIPFKE